MPDLKPLPSVAFAVDKLFKGTNQFSRDMTKWTGEIVTKQTVSTWKRVDRFPAKYMVLLTPKLLAFGYEPDPKHFSQKGMDP